MYSQVTASMLMVLRPLGRVRRHSSQRLVHNPKDRSQRMILWNPPLAIYITEQNVASCIPSAHRDAPTFRYAAPTLPQT